MERKAWQWKRFVFCFLVFLVIVEKSQRTLIFSSKKIQVIAQSGGGMYRSNSKVESSR